MSGATPSSHREGPARARALARQRAAEGPESATAWLEGSHLAIALHPEWQQLQAHLQQLAKVAVGSHLTEAHPQVHPHTIEAVWRIAGDIFSKEEGNDVFRGMAKPHLLHEPYMSGEGAVGMVGQTLADVARKVDQEAEARGTLESPEFAAFRELVSSIYVGSLQKRAEHIESNARLPAYDEKGSQKALGTMTLQATQGGGEENKNPRRTTEDVRSQVSSPEQGVEDRRKGGAGKSTQHNPGTAVAGHQACSGDIAQALVAIARGEGFERFTSTPVGAEGSAQAHGRKGGAGQRAVAAPLAEGHARVHNGGAKGIPGGAEEEKGAGGSSGSDSSGAQQQLLQREKQNLERAAAELKYLSEDDASQPGRLPAPDESESTTVGSGSGSGNEEGIFPGLEWLTPHIIGRSIPMELRRELWQRMLLLRGGGGPVPAEVKGLITRYAREKGIVDPTITPIAGMVATGVRHRAVEAFPWLLRGGAAGEAEEELRQLTCREAEKLLNQHFVLVGKHSARHVASSLLLAHVFGRRLAMASSSGEAAGEEAESTAAATLVAMLHSLATRFAPDAEDVRLVFRPRAYEEIRRRDPPLFEHLTTLFPTYKYGNTGGEGSSDAGAADDDYGDESTLPRGLVGGWLEDAFVGYLREDALLFVWDHLFLLGWREQLPLFAADVALLLRTCLLRATSPLTLLSLAKDASRRLCTRDIRDAFRRRQRTARPDNNSLWK